VGLPASTPFIGTPRNNFSHNSAKARKLRLSRLGAGCSALVQWLSQGASSAALARSTGLFQIGPAAGADASFGFRSKKNGGLGDQSQTANGLR
jgi:hypothetical protein